MNLPHPLDRPYQLQTAQRILESKAKFIIVNAPTGSGKSAYCAYAANQGQKIISLVKTKSLQAQYETGYNFTPIYGKGDYECLQFGQQPELFKAEKRIEPTADLCTVDEDYLPNCRMNCPYPLNRNEFIQSQAGIMNYAKFLTDRRLVEDFYPDILFLDEAHELADNIVIDFSGVVFSWKSKRLKDYTDPIIINTPQPIALKQGRQWLEALYQSLVSNKPQHPNKGGDLYHYKWWQRMKEKVDVTLACMDIEPLCWYIQADNEKFVCKPLTSQFHFLSLFNKAPKIVLMSATIQQQDIKALGIDDFEFIRVPNVVPAIMRPVYDLGGPKVTAGWSYDDQKEHAAIIGKCFNDRPGWNGLIHVTSEKMAGQLGDMLWKLTRRPIWIPEKGTGTNKSYANWQEFNNQNEGAICISWQFFAGVDAGDIAINICARTPYPYFGDDYEKSRFSYNPGQARVRVGNTVEQQLGRNRRGFNEHYGPMAKKFNAIVDAKWTKLKSAFQRDFLASISKV